MRAIKEMIRILRPMGRALIYVWAKNQALQSKSSYLLQNKRAHRDNDDDELDTKPSTAVASAIDTLPIHTNRTEFEHTDILVPWKLKNSKNRSTATSANDSESTESQTFLRFYHVFDEPELERLCQQFSEFISIEKSYYDQGNWCVIFQKRAQ